MFYIYILLLESNKYYIGKTKKPKFRIDKHFKSNTTAWTNKYKPVKLIEIIPLEDSFDEDKYTLKYMKKYGIKNVRGGSFSQVKMSKEVKLIINKMLLGSMDKCYLCGNTGHKISNCPPPNKQSKTIQTLIEYDRCFRCHRKGHYQKECYAKTYLDGQPISEDESYYCRYCGESFDTLDKTINHEELLCFKRKDSFIQCDYCGNLGHLEEDCYFQKKIVDFII